MSMQTAKRAPLPLYKLTNPGHVVTAGGVQVEVRYYTRAYVRVPEFVFQYHFKVMEILPDVVLGFPWLGSHNPTVDWKEWYVDLRHSTELQLQSASKLDLLSKPSSITSKVSPVKSPIRPAKEHPYLHSSTRAKSDANTLDESEMESSITD